MKEVARDSLGCMGEYLTIGVQGKVCIADAGSLGRTVAPLWLLAISWNAGMSIC